MQAGKPLIDCTKKGLGLAGKHLFHGFSGKIAENRVETLPQKMLHLLCVFQKMLHSFSERLAYKTTQNNCFYDFNATA